MSSTTKNRFPEMISDLFNTEKIFGPEFYGYNGNIPGFTQSIPSVNIRENGDYFKIEMAAPGLEKNDFKIEISNGVLIVSAEKASENKEENEHYRRKEFSYHAFRRTFPLPENSLPDKVDAKYLNGILEIILPKKEAMSPVNKKEIKVS